eukprot:jgi/Psemu1/189252/e_gw1.86.40.1
MPSKNKKDNDDDFKQEGNQKLQAVVLADAFFGSKVTAREDYQSFGLKPWSSEPSTTAKLLCKLNNIPLVDYVLDFLASNGVEQVILILGGCCATTTALEDHLSSHKHASSLEFLFLKDTSLNNAGDALRELYKRNWIRASKNAKPFLLVSGDVVADLDLAAAMDAHMTRSQHDSAAVMTVVLKPTAGSGTNHSITAATVDAQDGSDNDDDGQSPSHPGNDYRILYYDNGSSNKVGATVPCTFLTQSQSAFGTNEGHHGGLVLRHDLFDTGIVICSPDVLGLLSDSFDYLDLAHDFVTNSVAEEEDGLQTRIYAHVLDKTTATTSRNYAARAVDFQTYHAISRDLLLRWAYPTVADRVLSSGEDRRYKLCKEILHPTKVGRTSVIHGPGMMGSHGNVGEACLLERCVLGENVVIGEGAQLIDCHLMDGVVIGEGAQLNSCVVAQNATIRSKAVLDHGCFVGENCVIGEGILLPAFSRITLVTEKDDYDWHDDDDDIYISVKSSSSEEGGAAVTAAAAVKTPSESAEDTDHKVVGTDGKGKPWEPTLDVDDYSIDSKGNQISAVPLEALLQLQSIGGDSTAYYHQREALLARREAEEFGDDGFSDAEDDDEEEVAERKAEEITILPVDPKGPYPGPSPPSIVDEPVIGRQKGIDVVKEMMEICMEFDDEFHPIENLSIELNSFKFSQNATYSDCASACILSLLRKMEVSPSMSDGQLLSVLQAKLNKFWTGMLKKLCRGVEEELAMVKSLEHAALVDQQQSPPPSGDSAVTDAWQTSTEIAQKLRSGNSFRLVLHALFDQEVLSEDAILAWATERRNETTSEDDPKQVLFQMPSIQEFVDWLEASDDEGDSDGSDSDSDSNSD